MLNRSFILIPSIEEKNVICDYLGQTALVLAKNNTVIVVLLGQALSLMEWLRASDKKLFYKDQGVWYFTPIIFFPSRLSFIKKLSIVAYLHIVLLLGFVYSRHNIIWFFFPELVDYFPFWLKKIAHIHYDIVDYYFSPIPEKNYLIQKNKQRLMHLADTISAISTVLKEKYQDFSSKEISVVAQGFRVNYFSRQLSKPQIKLPNQKPVVGFVGAINNRLDFLLLKKLVAKLTEVNFVFIGPLCFDSNVSVSADLTQFQRLLENPNCFWFDQQPKDQIPLIIKQFDVAIIPYDSQLPFNRYSYPMKLFEYFYMGKPVLCTQLRAVAALEPLVLVSDEAEFWSQSVKSLVSQKWPLAKKSVQKKLALANSWESKVGQISHLIESYQAGQLR